MSEYIVIAVVIGLIVLIYYMDRIERVTAANADKFKKEIEGHIGTYNTKHMTEEEYKGCQEMGLAALDRMFEPKSRNGASPTKVVIDTTPKTNKDDYMVIMGAVKGRAKDECKWEYLIRRRDDIRDGQVSYSNGTPRKKPSKIQELCAQIKNNIIEARSSNL